MKLTNFERLVDKLARNPKLWDLFEKIFGDDEAKKQLYLSKIPIKCKILDFGCATGNTTEPFVEYEYVGVDNDVKLIEMAKKKWSAYKNVKFYCVDILKKSKELGKFDAILFAGTGHHLSDSLLVKILVSLKQCLKSNGSLHFIDTIKPTSGTNLITRWLCQIDRGKNIRTKESTLNLLKGLRSIYQIQDKKVETVTGTLLPQPSYIYVKLCLKRK